MNLSPLRVIVPVLTALAFPGDAGRRLVEPAATPAVVAAGGTPPPQAPPLPYAHGRTAIGTIPFDLSPDGRVRYPASMRGPSHTVSLTFAIEEDRLERYPRRVLDDCISVTQQVLNLMKAQFAQLDHSETVNPFEPFETALRVEPQVSLVFTSDMPSYLATLGAPSISMTGTDGATLGFGLSGEHGASIHYFVIVDMSVLKQKAARLVAESGRNWTFGIIPVLVNTVIHEFFGHLPSHLVGTELQDYAANELQATRRGLRMFEWYVGVMEKTAAKNGSDLGKRLRSVLATEQALLRTWEARVTPAP